jgi:hypothetical protein
MAKNEKEMAMSPVDLGLRPICETFEARILCIFSLFVLLGCTTKNKNQEDVNLVVTDKRDTIAYFNYATDYFKKYYFLDKHNSLDSAVGNKQAQSKLLGEFQFGFRDRTNPTNRLIAFWKIPISVFKISSAAALPFLHEEFDLQTDYDVSLIANQIDSLATEVRKIEVQIAIDKNSGDTLIYQESTFTFRKPDQKELILTVLIYDKPEVRNEMIDFVKDIQEKVHLNTTPQSQ